jgi:RNA-binding protein NOB1
VQNVLVQMGLGLVGEGGKRIKSVKSWVLRCHACFK